MPLPIALNILNQICDALDYAHNLCDETGQPLGIIHRDVSPSNIIVSDGGVVKLIDFGIAKASARRHADDERHDQGQVRLHGAGVSRRHASTRARICSRSASSRTSCSTNQPLFRAATTWTR